MAPGWLVPLRGCTNLDFGNAGLAKWLSVGQQNSSFSHRDGADSNLTTQAGKQPLETSGNENTHSWALEEKRGRDRKEEGDGESRRRLPQSSICRPDWWGEDRRESRDPGPSPSQHP